MGDLVLYAPLSILSFSFCTSKEIILAGSINILEWLGERGLLSLVIVGGVRYLTSHPESTPGHRDGGHLKKMCLRTLNRVRYSVFCSLKDSRSASVSRFSISNVNNQKNKKDVYFEVNFIVAAKNVYTYFTITQVF